MNLVISEISGSTGIIKLNRPEKKNALSPSLIKEFVKIMDEFTASDKIRVVIITGEGDVFSAGADLAYLNQLRDSSVLENEKDSSNIVELVLSVWECNKPVICAVNGPAIAGGCGLATAADFIIADVNKAKFGYSEVKIGFLPAIVSFLLLKRVGEVKTKQLLISGKIISPVLAKEIGLIDELSENVLESALNLANDLLKNSQKSMVETKRFLRSIPFMDPKTATEYLKNYNVISRTTTDFKEGINSFLKKR